MNDSASAAPDKLPQQRMAHKASVLLRPMSIRISNSSDQVEFGMRNGVSGKWTAGGKLRRSGALVRKPLHDRLSRTTYFISGGFINYACFMDEIFDQQPWPVLDNDDAGLLKEIQQLLTTTVAGDPYGDDGAFAASIAVLPPGLRAMAATHWLDISLTLDSITWHFGNFGEPQLIAETEAGLRELGLHELASCFVELKPRN